MIWVQRGFKFISASLMTLVVAVSAVAIAQPSPAPQISTGQQPAKGQMLPIQDRPVETLIIGIDLSGSNPMIKDRAFAKKVAARIKPMIAKLGPKSRIILRTFGSYDVSSNQLKLDQSIAAKRNLPDDVATLVAGIVGGIPTLIDKGTIKVQSETNIVAFLDNMAKVAECKKVTTRVILATDGIEDSELANLNRQHKDGVPNLPAPKPSAAGRPPFESCTEFMILGLGQGTRSPEKTQFLTDEWSKYATAAGFKTSTLLNDW